LATRITAYPLSKTLAHTPAQVRDKADSALSALRRRLGGAAGTDGGQQGDGSSGGGAWGADFVDVEAEVRIGLKKTNERKKRQSDVKTQKKHAKMPCANG
jgi:hypothetical protein